MQTRRKRLKVWISDEEQVLLDAKANYYGYKTLSSYIRDACIYEKVTYIDLKGKEEIYTAYSENTKELKKIVKEIRHISRYATQIKNADIENITALMYRILAKQKTMLNLIENKLDLNICREINHSKIKQEKDEILNANN